MRTLSRWPSVRAVTSKVSWRRVGWCWAVAFLVLPNCSLDRRGIGGGTNLNPGSLPRSSAIFCDIETNVARTCSTAEDRATGIPLGAAAVALNAGQSSGIGLDESPEALARCGGVPEVVHFANAFPGGTSACLNCEVIGPPSATPTPIYADANAACVAKCKDVVRAEGPTIPPPADVTAFCESHTHTSTNFSTCVADVCTNDGTPRADFVDPRRTADRVVWTDLVGVDALTNTLNRTAATTGVFDAGAASTQWITKGDAYVELSAAETNKSHVIGLSQIAPGCAFPCPDTDPSLADVTFGISLNSDGRVYVVEGGVLAPGPDVGGSFGTYAAGERFRVTLTNRWDSPGTITYSRIMGSCTPGAPCPATVLFTHAGSPATYPLRVDATFREFFAVLSDVRVVRVQ